MSARTERGFALVAVLLVLALLGVIGAEFAYSMRLEASAVRSYKASVAAGHLAEAGLEQAIREIVAEAPYAVLAEDGQLTFFARDGMPLPRLPRTNVPLAGGQFSYRLTDEEARLNLNTAPPERVERLLQALGVEKRERDTIVDSLQDWRDANENHRLNGAESDDTYLKLPEPYRSHNANLEAIAELLQIKGVTPALYYGREGQRSLADAVTVKTQGLINLNTVSDVVLRALGISDAEIIEIEQARRLAPYMSLPGRFGGRGLATVTRTFRVEADGRVDGQVRARLTAVIQRQAGGSGQSAVAVLEWSGVH
jgi:general secretion pathway protein K